MYGKNGKIYAKDFINLKMNHKKDTTVSLYQFGKIMRQIDLCRDVAEANADALTALQRLYRRICCNDLSNWYCKKIGTCLRRMLTI
ncbi:hypothetical protein BC008_23670 [Mastigocoleus testarum BC008]|uniref:Uncharacterized protein n=1 Tax=Mastigocoleus testarum BC008 TaxID=371196 RepID=A0A0V7ZNM6_9CYAN|nr:hypothetical protein BC008_23670 [Mastigocoleus testarum BC008]